MPFYVYIIQSLQDGSYYIGSTNNLDDRIERHNQGRSKYTTSKRPWKLKHIEEFPDRSSATKREKITKDQKSKEFLKSLVRTSRRRMREGREFPAQKRDLGTSSSSSPPVISRGYIKLHPFNFATTNIPNIQPLFQTFRVNKSTLSSPYY